MAVFEILDHDEIVAIEDDYDRATKVASQTFLEKQLGFFNAHSQGTRPEICIFDTVNQEYIYEW